MTRRSFLLRLTTVLTGLCFLLSAEAAAINGSVVTLDGGLGALKLPEL